MSRIGPTRPTSSLRADFTADDLHDRGTRKLLLDMQNVGSYQRGEPGPVHDEREYAADDDFPGIGMVFFCGFAIGVAVGSVLVAVCA